MDRKGCACSKRPKLTFLFEWLLNLAKYPRKQFKQVSLHPSVAPARSRWSKHVTYRRNTPRPNDIRRQLLWCHPYSHYCSNTIFISFFITPLRTPITVLNRCALRRVCISCAKVDTGEWLARDALVGISSTDTLVATTHSGKSYYSIPDFSSYVSHSLA